jgi:G:T-mismatch repair DNA endonuclease (very short patch repair protein)
MSISDSKRTKITIEKTKNTNLKLYGYENVSKSEKIKQQKKDTFIKNYGVDNVWKLREYRLWWEDEMKKKYGTVCLSNLHGNENNFGWRTQDDETKLKRSKQAKEGYKKWYNNLSAEEKVEYNHKKSIHLVHISPSKLEKRIEKLLIKSNIFYKPQYWINKRSYDFWLGKKVILEVQGTYWHCDPRVYKEDDLVRFGDTMFFVKDIWNKDDEKKKNAEKYGYKVFYIWEYDMNSMLDEELLSYIQNIINEDYDNLA